MILNRTSAASVVTVHIGDQLVASRRECLLTQPRCFYGHYESSLGTVSSREIHTMGQISTKNLLLLITKLINKYGILKRFTCL